MSAERDYEGKRMKDEANRPLGPYSSAPFREGLNSGNI
jgi:hypothetical protein